MASLQSRLNTIAVELQALYNSMAVDPVAAKVFLENHRPRKNSDQVYMRLRAQNETTLPNGNRTKILTEAETTQWQERIAACEQRTKIEKCLELVEQAAGVASGIKQSVKEPDNVVNNFDLLTTALNDIAMSGIEKKPKLKSKPKSEKLFYVFKGGKYSTSYTTSVGRTVHLIKGDIIGGRAHVPALCGTVPSKNTCGWVLSDLGEVDCPKCYAARERMT